MKNLHENALMQEMSLKEMTDTNGGLFPIVILGVTITGKTAAAIAAGSIFAAGVYVGYQEAQENN